MIKISKEKWNSIPTDYKGTWQDYYNEKPEWLGRKVVLSGCITNNPSELGKLLVEGVHFIIVGKMINYFDAMADNYCIPTTEYTEELDKEVKEFLKEHTEYFMMYLSVNDGYTEDMWCITNWLE